MAQASKARAKKEPADLAKLREAHRSDPDAVLSITDLIGLGFSRRHVMTAIASGKLRAIRTSDATQGVYRIKRRWFDEWCEAEATATAPAATRTLHDLVR